MRRIIGKDPSNIQDPGIMCIDKHEGAEPLLAGLKELEEEILSKKYIEPTFRTTRLKTCFKQGV